MIQRKQSLFLFIGAVVMALLYFFPIAEFMVANTDYYFNYIEIASVAGNSKKVVSNTYPVTVLLSLVIGISIITIFLFKNRNLQMRLTTINMLLKVGFLILIVFYIYEIGDAFESKHYLQLSFVFPLIALILDFMAYKGIQKDMNIIKSYDRIR